MRKIILLAIIFFAGVTATAQDFSNKGKEFWLCFPAHVASGSSLAQFTIWITSDMASSGTVTLTNGAFSANFIVGANGLTSVSIPYSAAHISNAESFAVIQKSIRVKVNPGMPAVVAYAQQFGQARSAATLLLPTNVLGKKYYAVSFTQSGTGAAKSQFQIIATKPNTYVTVTPRWNGVLQTPFTINFPNIGDIYQYQSDQDITGSYIESIASGSGGCNPIAVFSGSSALTMGTNTCTGGNSYDPLFQQAYPVTTWGKNFGFIPFGDYTNGNPYRIMASEDGTKVIINGSAVATLNAGEIYPPAFTSSPTVITQPTSISSDKPICVTQYAQKRDCSGTNNGDPDMVILNPIEQNISNITIFSSTQENINRQWINVLIKTAGVATFRINGAVPSTPFIPAPNIPGYSYMSHRFIPASSQSYLLSSDSGFNAIAYGFEQGQYESYAYSAGTNVKDLYQQIGVSTEYGIEPTPSVCTNTPFKFKVSLPYCADSIRWDLSFLPGPPNPAIDTIRYSTCTPGPGGPDSTTVVNGVTLYWYSLPTPYSFSVIGSFPVAITTYAPNSSGCGSEQLIDFNLQVSAPPLPGFTYTAGGCLAVPFQFTETTLQSPKPTYHWYWDFGDGVTSTTVRNPLHTYAAPGTYTVRYSSITTPGCLSDTVVQTITVPDLPNATLSGTNLTACVNSAILPTITFTGSLGTPEYIFNYTIDNGSGPGPVLTSPTSIGGVVIITHPTFAAGTFIYNIVSVRNVGTALCTRNITGQVVTVNILANHAVGLAAGSGPTTQAVCINNPIVSISYNLSGGATGATVAGLPAGVTYSVTGTTLNIIGSPNPVFAGGSAVYPYTVSTTGNSCLAATASGSITVNNDHTLSLNAGSTPTQTVCINSLIVPIAYTIGGGATGVTVTGLPAGVTYTVVGTTVTINGAPSTTVGSPFTYTINTTGNACIPAPSLSGILTVNPNHAVGLAAGSGPTTQAVCINNPIVSISYNLSGGATGATVAGLPAGVTYSVTGTTLNIIGSPNPVFAGGSAVYPYTVSTTGNSCLAATASGSITVNNDHTLSLNAGSTPTQTVCINSLIAPIAYTIGGGATGVTVTGLPAGVTYTVVGTTVTINGAPSTTVGSPFAYTINTTGNACVPAPSLSGILTVNPNHAVGLAAGSGPTTQAVCINTPIVSISYNLSGGATGATVAGLPAGVSFSVTGTTLNIIGSPNPVFAGGSAVYPYTVSTTGNSCLAATASGSITVNNDHTLSLNAGSTPTQTVCINSLIVPIAYTIGGGATGVTVTGLPAGVTYTVVGTTVTINGAPSTTVGSPFSYTINTTGNTCVPAAPLGGTISANPLPTALMSGDIEVCQNAAMPNIAFTGTNATAPYTFTYSVNGGAPQTVSTVGASSSVTIQQSTAVANTFTYTLLSVQDASSTACTQLQNGTVVVKVNPLPTAAIGGARLVCINSTAPDITFTGAGGTTPYIFTYRVNAGAPQTISTTGSNTSVTLSASTSVAGTFTYTLESVQDGSSTACIQAQTGDAVIVVSDTFPQPNFSIDKPSYCIPNAIVIFSNTSSIADGSSMTYLWNFGDGSANSMAFNPPPHWYGSMGPFNVVLQAQSTTTGCIHDTTIVINNIHPQPKAGFTFNKPGICIGDNVTITDKSDGIDGAINQWNWNLGDGSTRTISSFTHIYTDTITYNVSLYSINTFGCNSDTLTKQFTVYPYPHVNAGPDRFILEGGTITLDPVVYANDAQYVWTPNLYLIDNKVAKVKVNKPLTDMTYRLTVTARGGCTLGDEVFIKLLKFPVIPNTFTPNNDGINDKWRIDYLNTYPDNRVQIFTRNGNLVFESKGYNTPWDGTLKGKPLPFDTYYYIIEPGNGRDPITGYVTILK